MRTQVFGILLLAALSAAFPLIPLADADEPASEESGHLEESEHETELTERLVVPSEPLRHHVLSLATGQFVAITKSGRVHANAQIGKHSYVCHDMQCLHSEGGRVVCMV